MSDPILKTILSESVDKINAGATFSIDFENRGMTINRKPIISSGSYEGVLSEYPEWNTHGEFIEALEYYYERYRNSVPSERSEAKRRKYFTALPLHQLEDDDMLYGERRDIAQFRLEFHVLAAIIGGGFKWSDFADDKWFWQSPSQPSLILLRQWFEPKNKK